MQNGKLRISFLVLASAVAVSLVAGCSRTNGTTAGGGSSAAAGTVSYPIQTSETLSVWCAINANAQASNYNDIPLGQEIEKGTGIHVNYTHPSNVGQQDQFNLMIASGNLPDIIEGNWASGYPGGISGAANDGLIIPLDKLLPKDSPDLWNLFQKNPELNKETKTDDGKHYVYPHIRNDISEVYFGPIIRKDWLDKLSLPVPVTMDDWHNVLTKFKTISGVTAPLTFQFDPNAGPTLDDAFIGAYKTSYTYFVDDNGKVQFGPATPQYKDFLTTFHQWYEEGLIDPNFAVCNGTTFSGLVNGYKTGAFTGLLGGGIKTYLDTLAKKDPSFNVIGTTYPVLKKGDTPFNGQHDTVYFSGYDSVITTKCKDPDLAAKWLNYAYSKEGNLVYNFGQEGKTYTMVNGVPTFTDFVYHNPDGLSSNAVLAKYTKLNGSYADDVNYTTQNMVYQQQKDAVASWSRTDALKHNMPPITLTEDEAKTVGKSSTDINTLVATYFTKFIMGKEPLSNFDSYVSQLNSMGLRDNLKAEQAAYDRYKKR